MQCPAYTRQRDKMERALGRVKRDMSKIMAKVHNMKILIRYVVETGRISTARRDNDEGLIEGEDPREETQGRRR